MGRGLLVGFGVAVAFAAGVAVGTVIGSAPTATETVVRTTTVVAAADDAEIVPVAGGPRGTATTRARAHTEAPADVAVPAGDGVITGTVRTSRGDPVEGIDVVASASAPAEWEKEIEHRRFEDLPLDERVARFARVERWRDATTRRARTAGDGTYSLTGVPDLAHHVQARSDAHRIRVAAGSKSSDVKPGARVDFTADPRSGLILDVTLPDGSAPDAAQVEIRRGSSSSTRTWSKGSRRVDADPGPARLTVTAGRWNEFRSDTADVEIADAVPAEPRAVRLVARRGILVVTKSPPGFEGITPVVRVVGPSGAEVGANWGHRMRAPRGSGDPASPHERVELDLENGPHVVTVSLDGETTAKADVVVADGMARVEMSAPPPSPDRAVAVTVSPAAAVARGNVSFGWVQEGPNSRASWGARAAWRGGAEWTVLTAGPGDERQGYSSSGADDPEKLRWTLSLRIDNVPRGSVAWTPGTRAVTIPVEEPMWVDVVVEGVAGTPLARKLQAHAWIVKRSEGGGTSMNGLGGVALDSQGRGRLGPYEPGTIEVMISIGEEPFGAPTVAHAVVEGGRGVREARLRLPPLETVTFELGAARAGQQVNLVREEDGTRTRFIGGSPYFGAADAQGRWVARWLPHGDWTVHAGGAQKRFTVPGTTVVTIP